MDSKIERTLENLAKKFVEKNPSFVRDIMEAHFISFEAEFKEGKLYKCNITKKNYKEEK